MAMINLVAAWIGFVLGVIAGAAAGLRFHDAAWLGGYASWPRRMTRLGHISLFGIGLLNLAFALTVDAAGLTAGIRLPSTLLLVGAVGMPAVCYLSAWKPPFRHLFFIPVLSVLVAAVLVAGRLVSP